MPDDFTPKLERASERIDTGPGNTVVTKVVVSYKVGTHGPFTLSYDAATFTAQQARQDMQARADQLKQLAM